MNTTQLILLALNCINENREPTHTEQSHIYVFYRTHVVDEKLTIDAFIDELQLALIDKDKIDSVIKFVSDNLFVAYKKHKSRASALI